MFCPKCGEKNPDGARFCARCGAAIAAAGPMPGPVPGPTPISPHRRSRMPLVVAGVVAVVVVAVAAALVLPGLLGGDRAAQERQASNASLGYSAASSGDYDYFYSSSVGGLCRAKHDGSAVELLRAVDVETQYIPALAIDGGTLFFVVKDYYKAPYEELRSIRTDGSQEKLLMTAPDLQTIDKVCVYDQKLYVTMRDFSGSESEGMTKVSVMSEDGTDAQQLCSLPLSDYVVVLPDAVYYLVNSDGSYALNAWSSDTKQTRTLCTGSSTCAEMLCVAGGRLVYLEDCTIEDNMFVGRTLVSVDTEGQSRKVLWTSDSDETGVRLVAASGDAVYAALYKTGSDGSWDLLRVPLDGADAQTVARGLTFYAPTACDMGDHLIVFENGGHITDGGVRVMTITYDGSDRMAYPLG